MMEMNFHSPTPAIDVTSITFQAATSTRCVSYRAIFMRLKFSFECYDVKYYVTHILYYRESIVSTRQLYTFEELRLIVSKR